MHVDSHESMDCLHEGDNPFSRQIRVNLHCSVALVLSRDVLVSMVVSCPSGPDVVVPSSRGSRESPTLLKAITITSRSPFSCNDGKKRKTSIVSVSWLLVANRCN